jgi:hypothetical protein
MADAHSIGKTPADETDSNLEMWKDAHSIKLLNATISTMNVISPGSLV